MGTFYIAEHGMLPPLPARDGNKYRDIGHIADVFWESKFFGNMTPAQIATQILVGESLGLDPAQSMFDLVVGPGPSVTYKLAQPLAKVSDEVEAVKVSLRRATGETDMVASLEFTDRLTPNPALEARNDEKGVVVEGGFANVGPLQNGETVVVEMPARDVTAEPAEPEPAGDDDKPDLEPLGPRDDESDVPEPETPTAADNGEARAELEPMDDVTYPNGVTDMQLGTINAIGLKEQVDTRAACKMQFGCKLTELTKEQASDFIAWLQKPMLIRALEPAATPDVALSSSVTPEIGVGRAEPAEPLTAETVAVMRRAVENILVELGYQATAVNERLEKFDAGSDVEKRDIIDASQRFYMEKVDHVRADVMAQLTADGKNTLEKQKGFYIFATVPTEPAEWTYAEAVKAQTALKDFIRRK